jgi:hypothetical protein
MLRSRIGRNYIICFLVLNALLIGPFVYALLKRPGLMSSFLPGTFGGSMSPDLSGNMLFLALLLLVNALLALVFGIGGTWHGLWAGLRISPRKMRWLLHERAGLASDISGIVAAAVQEEEKAEIAYIGHARGLLFVGLVLFALALPALCIAYTHAAPDSSPIFEQAGQTIPNGSVGQNTIVRFTVDQLAGGLLLDVPEIFHLRATPVETNGANLLLGLVVLLYRTLIGLGVLLLYIGMRRSAALRAFAMETPLPVAEIVAMEPVFQDGHGYDHHDRDHGHDQGHDHGHGHDDHGGHDEHHHDVEEAPVHHHHEEHVHHETRDDHHGHADDDAGSDDADENGEEAHDHGHEDHGHGDHTSHDAHGHDDDGHDAHHGHDDDHQHGHHVQAAVPSEELAEDVSGESADRAGEAVAADGHRMAREPEYESG